MLSPHNRISQVFAMSLNISHRQDSGNATAAKMASSQAQNACIVVESQVQEVSKSSSFTGPQLEVGVLSRYQRGVGCVWCLLGFGSQGLSEFSVLEKMLQTSEFSFWQAFLASIRLCFRLDLELMIDLRVPRAFP